MLGYQAAISKADLRMVPFAGSVYVRAYESESTYAPLNKQAWGAEDGDVGGSVLPTWHGQSMGDGYRSKVQGDSSDGIAPDFMSG